MSGHHKWAILRDQMRRDPVRAAKLDRMKSAMDDAVRLSTLREARQMTQHQVAQALGSSQANVSKLERRDDVYLSTLSDYVEALGGSLELRAVFPDEVITIDVAVAKEPSRERASSGR